MDLIVVSNILLWISVIILSCILYGVIRQVGVLHERVSPIGALTINSGPQVGERSPQFNLKDLNGQDVIIGGSQEKSLLLFFLSPNCPICKKLLPVLKSLRKDEPWLNIVLASDGNEFDHKGFYLKNDLYDFSYIISIDLGMAFHVSKLPFAVLIDKDGVIRAKGLVNSREQIESLFNAMEFGVKSLQEYVAKKKELGLV
jgi:methylamine dehydrogenase accessory protein MauD